MARGSSERRVTASAAAAIAPPVPDHPSPLRLRLDGAALVANWRWLKARGGGAACGAAVKANAYGLGAVGAARRLADAGCRDFFVATWDEADEIAPHVGEAAVSVLHGVQADEMERALAAAARPILSTPAQIARWRETGRPCDVMVDTGMNRLGVAPEDVAAGLLDGLALETLHSHLASADEDGSGNDAQRRALAALAGRTRARRLALANSAGICLGPAFAFDLTRPGLALYGGIPRREAVGAIVPVARLEARIVQRRRLAAGAGIGYNATYIADRPREVAIVHIGYADGYLRGFSGTGEGRAGGVALPVLGRVSMDLTALAVDAAPGLAEGDWVEMGHDLPDAARRSGLSQYELLTTLGRRFARIWD